MPVTQSRGRQIRDDDVGREDINITTAGRALITKLIAGTNIGLSYTGADVGTGDVTVNLSGTVAVANGGTGATSLTGLLVGNGTSAVTAVAGTAGQLLRRNAGNTAYEFFTHDFVSITAATTNTIPKWTSGTALGLSNISDNGSLVTIASNSYITGNLTLGQATSALQSGGTGITIYDASFSEIKFLNSTTGALSTDGTALVLSGLNFTINNRENGNITFATNSNTRLTIGSDGNTTFTGQIVSTLANNTATGGGQIFLNGANGNRIDYAAVGVAAPAFTTRSLGTKIVLYPAISASAVDYAIGVENGAMWYSVNLASAGFKWYAGTTNIATLTGTGAVTFTGTLSASISALGTAATTFLTHTSGLVQSRTATQVLSDIGAQATLNGTGYVKMAGTSLSYVAGATTATANTVVERDASGNIAGVNGAFSGNVTWQGSSNGNPRSAVIGYSGSNYGQIGYGVAFTGTSSVHNYAVSDIVTLIELFNGINLYAASAGTVGNPITWTTVMVANRTTFTYMGSNVITAANIASNVGNGTLNLGVSGNGLSGSANFTANQSSSNTFTVTSNATSSNTASTIVFRDASGNFSAGTITLGTQLITDVVRMNTANILSIRNNVSTELANWNHSTGALNQLYALNVTGLSTLSGGVVTTSTSNATYSRIFSPNGGEYVTTTTTLTGAIRITLPRGMTGAMVRFTVKVYLYATNQSFEVNVGGYPYSVGNTWANNPFAYIIGNPSSDRRLTVRFGFDGTKAVIYIGELGTTWSYPQVFVTDVQRGFADNSSEWASGWSIGFESSAFQNVTATITNSQIGYSTSTATANAVVLRDSSGNFSAGAITMNNNSFLRGLNTSAAVVSLIGMGADNVIYVGDTGVASTVRLGNSGGNLQIATNGAATFSSTASATNFIGGGTGLTSLPSNTALYPTLNQDTSGYSARLLMFDTRTIAPNSHNAGRMTFGFTSWANNSSAPYADYIHFRSYGDASGGNDNLITFNKSAIGMRIWQQSWGSASAYSTYVDVLHSNNFGNYALPLAGGTMILGANINMVANDPGNGYITFKNTSNSDRVIRFGTGRVGVDYQGLSIYDETDAATRMFMNNAGDFQFNNSVTVGGNIIGLGGSNLILAAGDVYFNNDFGYGILSQNGTRAIAITNASVTSNRITEIYRNETVNRTTYNDLFVITAAATTNPFAGHGGGIRFRGTTYRSGTGVYDWGRIGMELTDNNVDATGENMFFEVASSDSSSTLTRAMTIRYNACVGIGTTTPVSKLEVSSASQDSHFAVLGTAPGIQLSDIRTSPTQFASIGLATTTNNYVTGSAQGDLVIVNRSTVTSKAIIFGIGTTNEVGRFATSGRLLLGTTSDDTVNRLQVNGSIKATKFTESSDRRIKTPITENILVGGVENIKAHLYLKDGLQEIGYYAQDVLPYIPSAVTKGADDVYTLEYRSVFAAKIASLENRVKLLEEELNKYKN